MLDRESFLSQLLHEFPEVEKAFEKGSQGLLHCEMGGFRKVVETAMDDGRHWQVQKYLEFLDNCLVQATPELENAILISFLEDFALGEVTRGRYEATRERMPDRLRKIVVETSDNWR